MAGELTGRPTKKGSGEKMNWKSIAEYATQITMSNKNTDVLARDAVAKKLVPMMVVGGSTRTIGNGRHDRSLDSRNGSEPLQPTNRANADIRRMGCFRARSRHDVGVRSHRRANGVRRPP